MSKTRAYLILVIAFLFVCAAAYTILSRSTVPLSSSPAPSSAVDSIPALTDAVKAQLAASKGFQYLVSYTDRGFEPGTATIKKGETIRWTNNSLGTLWISSTGASGAVYPGTGKECGQSAFDSCRVIGRGEFWEFTFTRSGTWSYKSNSDTSKIGTVTVK